MLAVFAAPAAYARSRHSDAWAREHFAGAERMREALNGRPPADRTRRDYQRVLNAYRYIYLGAPASTKADPSVVAVAETLVEMGRRFDDDKILNEAIEQYKFLRREYPGSKYRFDGLFTIGEIYKDDLNDPNAARSTFQEFLRRYPHNRLADDARQAIVELNQEAEAQKAAEAQKTTEKSRSGKNGKNSAASKDAGGADSQASRAALSKDLSKDSGKDPGKDESDNQSPEPRSGRLARVTGIRHWSTPDYTRVAIDVESDVKFVSQRIDSPARIFFDLRDTKLASTLVGKSFDVDDGFLKKVRVAQFAPGRTRVVLEVDNLSDYDAFLLPNPYRLIIDIHGKNGRARQNKDAGGTTTAEVDGEPSPKTVSDDDADQESPESKATVPAHTVAVNENARTSAPGTTASKKPQTALVKRVVDAEDDEDAGAESSAGRKNARAVMGDVSPASKLGGVKKLAKSDLDSDAGIREARPTASGDRSLIRALGLKIGKIVIDPGHGGHDTGTIGPNGLEEKDLVLEVGRRLGKLLETRLGAEVVYTRKDDTFIPLETRTAVANQARADLFVSIHANSSHDESARGVETYYLNFTSSPEALEVAARENAVSEKSIYELQDLVKKIALKEKIEESREFAGDVQQSLHSGLAVKSPAIRDRGVKKAPFIVLIGANMPSILAEISFVSNPTDEHRLATSEYRQRIAESLYRGIAKYVNGLSGVKVASKMDKAAGQ
jgi:N-acetylmuramoyl-L-alanine amidase